MGSRLTKVRARDIRVGDELPPPLVVPIVDWGHPDSHPVLSVEDGFEYHGQAAVRVTFGREADRPMVWLFPVDDWVRVVRFGDHNEAED